MARRNVEVRREEILAATVAEVQRGGLAQTRVADVASALGISPALVFYHFETKDRLLAEAFAYAAERDLVRLTHQTIKSCTDDIEAFKFNTYIAGLMKLRNALQDLHATETARISPVNW